MVEIEAINEDWLMTMTTMMMMMSTSYTMSSIQVTQAADVKEPSAVTGHRPAKQNATKQKMHNTELNRNVTPAVELIS
jgi:hypothetical protein